MSDTKRTTSLRRKLPRSWSMRSRSKSPRPAHHANDSKTSFRNPWPSADAPTWMELSQNSFPLGWYDAGLGSHESARDVKVVTPDWGAQSLDAKGLDRRKCVIGTWLGHAGALVEIPLVGTTNPSRSCWLLFDPIFSLRAGPTQYTGPRRMKESPCQVDDLPGCDAVFISHNHYDHLDLSTIKDVRRRFPNARFYVPLGNRSWLAGISVPPELIFELDWWQCRVFGVEDLGHEAVSESEDETLIRVTCTPAQHNSGRTGVDGGSSLWCGWVAEQLLCSKDESTSPDVRRHSAIYHAGDTGYRRTAKSDIVCPAFEEIGSKLGPFDLSFIPIWRGGTLGFISYIGLRLSHHDFPAAMHGSPADAVDIHLDVKSRNSVAVHFGTFIGSENESYEAVIEFAGACRAKNVSKLDEPENEKGRAGVLDIGESLVVEIK